MNRLNLLPSEIKKEIELSKKNARLRQLVYYSVMISIGFVALYATLIFYLNTVKNETDSQKLLANQQIAQQNDLFSKAKDMYNRIVLIKKVKRQAIDWNAVLLELASKTPNNLQIDTFNFQKNDSRIKITGNASSDKDVAAFKDNLAASNYFSFVDLESISKGIDSKGREAKIFVLSMTLKQEAKK